MRHIIRYVIVPLESLPEWRDQEHGKRLLEWKITCDPDHQIIVMHKNNVIYVRHRCIHSGIDGDVMVSNKCPPFQRIDAMPAIQHEIHQWDVIILAVLGDGDEVLQANLLEGQFFMRKDHRCGEIDG